MKGTATIFAEEPKSGPIHGGQVIARTCNLLREIARHGSAGARLSDLRDASALSHATAHRILQTLLTEGFISRDPLNRRYRLGSSLFELGLAAPSPLEELASLRPILEDLALRIGDTAYLMMRRGNEIVCLAHAEGDAPLRARIIEVGAVRPICASLGGLCMLAQSGDAEVDRIMASTLEASQRFGEVTPSYLRREISQVRNSGYCISREVLLKAATGISAAVPNQNGPSFLAISISAVSARVPDSRVQHLVSELLAACNEMADCLARARGWHVKAATAGE